MSTAGLHLISVATGQVLVSKGQCLVGTDSGMVTTGIGKAGTGIDIGSGDAASSVGSGIVGNFASGYQTLSIAIDPKVLLAQQHSTSSGCVGRISVIPFFYRSNPVQWFRQLESQFVFAGITNDETNFITSLLQFLETLQSIFQWHREL